MSEHFEGRGWSAALDATTLMSTERAEAISIMGNVAHPLYRAFTEADHPNHELAKEKIRELYARDAEIQAKPSRAEVLEEYYRGRSS